MASLVQRRESSVHLAGEQQPARRHAPPGNHRGRVSYEPNSLAGGCPFEAGTAGFVSFPAPAAMPRALAKPPKAEVNVPRV